ncbi:hypothetical protein [Acetobacteroides hydrogenigenes]|uniref:Acetyltransferase (GNAT) family protein n=1 Tax=Acetobacteroides hydrogenigenes TaxID=979970 RepID=A0A4R2E2C6_9BACT|nr:hypothetical protein [Acetobacteroides hydrogenigenes]TCN62208.1 hypothetical protein CLV25_11941 [Acetobacteroides hydrogenigenes]
MNASDFVELNKKMGHNILTISNQSWIVRDDKSAISIPSLDNIFPSREELNLLKKRVRYALFKTEVPFFYNSSEFLFVGESYDINLFNSKVRNQIRKGLKSCIIKNPTLIDLYERGLYLNIETLKRHNRSVDYLQNKKKWSSYIEILKNTSDVTIKGAYINDKLIGYIIFIFVNGKYYIYHPFMDKEYSSCYPMNTILYTFINEIITKEGSINISYGLSSFLEKEGLDHFKKGMLFDEVKCTRILLLSDFYSLFINRYVYKIISVLSKFRLLQSKLYDKYVHLYKERTIYYAYLKYISK